MKRNAEVGTRNAEVGTRNAEVGTRSAEWRTVRLGDVVEINPRLNLENLGGGKLVGFVPMSAVCEKRKAIVSPEVRPLREVRKGYTPMQNGDVIIAKITPCFENGKVARVDLDQEVAFGSTEFHVFRGRGELDASLLFHLLRSNVLIAKGRAQMKGAAGQKRVPADFFRAFEFRVPRSLAAQRRLAGILDAADALRAKRRESLAQLDSLLQSTFQEMFGDPVTNPMGWEQCKFIDVAGTTFRNGLSPSNKGDVDGEVLTLSAITSGQYDRSCSKHAKFDRKPAVGQIVRKDTFLICRGNGNKEMVGIGVFPTHDDPEVCFPDTMIATTPYKARISPAYLEAVWASRSVRSQIGSGARTTNGTFKVNQSLLGSVELPLPPLPLQRRFASIVESVERQKTRVRAHLAELDALFASLQHRAFNGEL